MKKVGIITLNGFCNYGNRLQNAALTKILNDRNIIGETIWNGDQITIKELSKLVFKRILFFLNKKNIKRTNNFYNFNKRYTYPKIFNKFTLKKYSAFIVGSDQVWNPESIKDNINNFVPFSDNQLLISYAASLGCDTIPKNMIKIYNYYLKRFDYISVRETKAKEILIKQVNIKKNIEVVLDPTLLLSAEEWIKFETPPKKNIYKRYILNYFLGDLDENTENSILSFAKKNNCEIINILNKNDEFYDCGPSEFIYLIHNAYMICTDSFHSSVFSFVFNKPFVIFKRKGEFDKMYSRLDNFIRLFDLKDREYNDKYISEKNLNNDYSKSFSILKKEIIKSNAFLDEALKGVLYNENKS